MKIIISPAKKMVVDTDTYEVRGMPQYLEDTKAILRQVRELSREEAQALWKCNDKLTELNYGRFQRMDLEACLTPALIAYEGLQYQHLAPGVLSVQALEYVQEHLRILSGFYGVLRPFDGVTPYRLEMQARLSVDGRKDLYEYWGNRLYDSVAKGDGVILNLASKEYSRCVEKYCGERDRFLTVEFCVLSEGRLRQKGTLAKMARGEMVRFLAENQVEEPEGMKDFKGLGFAYSKEHSQGDTWIFVKEEALKG